MAFPVMAAVQGGLSLASGIASYVQGRKIAKEQQKEARAERSREAKSLSRRDALLGEQLSGSRLRASSGMMPGMDVAQEMAEKQTATSIENVRKGTRSGSDYLASVSALNQQAQQQSQNLALANTAWQERAFQNLLGVQGQQARVFGTDAARYGARAGELATASQQNRANALKGLFGGMVGAADAVPSGALGNIGGGGKTTRMNGTGAGMNLF